MVVGLDREELEIGKKYTKVWYLINESNFWMPRVELQQINIWKDVVLAILNNNIGLALCQHLIAAIFHTRQLYCFYFIFLNISDIYSKLSFKFRLENNILIDETYETLCLPTIKTTIITSKITWDIKNNLWGSLWPFHKFKLVADHVWWSDVNHLC